MNPKVYKFWTFYISNRNCVLFYLTVPNSKQFPVLSLLETNSVKSQNGEKQPEHQDIPWRHKMVPDEELGKLKRSEYWYMLADCYLVSGMFKLVKPLNWGSSEDWQIFSKSHAPRNKCI